MVTWGFTGATGGNSNRQQVCLEYVSFIEELQDTTICEGESVQLEAGTGAANSFSWSPATGLSATNIPNPVASPSTTTTYVLTVTDPCGTSRVDSVTITVNPALTADAGDDLSICPGSPAPLDGSGGVEYSWSPATGLSDPNSPNPLATPGATTTYTLTVSDGGVCFDTDEVAVTVLPKPTAVASVDRPICPGQSVLLRANGGVQYRWSPATGLNNPLAQNPLATPATTTTYTLVVTNVDGCTDTTSVTVEVQDLPDLAVSPDTAVCLGESVQLQASGAEAYNWTPTTGLSASNVPNPIASPTSSTTYFVTGISENGCRRSLPITVTVNSLPIAEAGPDEEICEGERISLQAIGGSSYSWSPTNGLTNPTSATPLASPRVTTTYSVTVTDDEGCQGTDSVVVVVNALPNIAITPPDTAICEGETTVLRASGAETYAWTPTAGVIGPSLANPTFNPTATTTYTVVGTSVAGCQDAADVTITVHPRPAISAGDDLSVCLGDSVQLSATGGQQYFWSPNDGLDPNDQNLPAPWVAPTETTEYRLTGTDARGCVNIDEVTVVVNALPEAEAGPDQEICLGENVILQGSGGASYAWLPATGLNNANISRPLASPLSTTEYVLTVTDDNGCEETDTLLLTVNELPDVRANTSDGMICEGETTTLLASGATSYLWQPGASLSNPNLATPTASPVNSTVYTVTGIGANGCENTDEVAVAVNPLPNVSAGADQTICEGASTQLMASGALSYVWSPSTGLDDATSASPEALPPTDIQYTVLGTDANGCSNTSTVNVFLREGPNATGEVFYEICPGGMTELEVAGAPSFGWSTGESGNSISVMPAQDQVYWVVPEEEGCAGDTLFIEVAIDEDLPILQAAATPLSGRAPHTVSFVNQSQQANQFFWSFGDGNGSEASNPSHTYTEAGTYTVQLTGLNELGCEASLGVAIIEVLEPEDLIPNVFTPNGDGINDTYVPRLGALQQYRILIFDRWGKKVFESTDPNTHWDGRFNGQAISEGVYSYLIEATKANGDRVEEKGMLTLMR